MRDMLRTFSATVIFLFTVGGFVGNANADARAVIPSVVGFILEEEEPVTCIPSPILSDFELASLPDEFFTVSAPSDVTNISLVTVSDTSVMARPGQVGDNKLLSVEADVSDFGAAGREFAAQDWSGFAGVSFWVFGDSSGEDLALELQSGGTSSNAVRASFTLDFSGWQLITLPFEMFSAFQGVFDTSAVTAWVIVLDGAITDFSIDDFAVLPQTNILQDYQDVNMNSEPVLPSNFFLSSSDGAEATIDVDGDFDVGARPAQVGDNASLLMNLDIPRATRSFGHDYPPIDVSDQLAVAFWMFGNNSGNTYTIVLQSDGINQIRQNFQEDFTGWKYVSLPLELFSNLGLFDPTQLTRIFFVAENVVTTIKIDDLSLISKEIQCSVEE